MDLKIKKGELSYLRDVLAVPELKSSENRLRTRFKKNIIVEFKKSEEERQLLIDEYAIKEDNGKYKILEGTEKLIDFGSVENAQIVWDNVFDLHNEYIYIPCNEENEKMLLTVANIMLEGDFKVSGMIADLHDEWCEQFEEVIEFYKNNKEGE